MAEILVLYYSSNGSVRSHAVTVLGGPHPTVLPDETAHKPFIDLVVRGEGEATWLELLSIWEPGRCLANSAIDRQVAGTTCRQADGVLVSMPSRAPIPAAELDSLAFPAWHLFKLDRYTNLQPTIDKIDGPSLPILTSRGCPYRCSYCSQIGPRLWRARSVESVLAEWRWLVQDWKAAEIGVLDDSFNIDRQRVLELCQRLVDERLNRVPWIMINGIRANIADEEVLGAMKQAGCIRTAFGVESGNQAILDSVVDKHLTLVDQVGTGVSQEGVARQDVAFCYCL